MPKIRPDVDDPETVQMVILNICTGSPKTIYIIRDMLTENVKPHIQSCIDLLIKREFLELGRDDRGGTTYRTTSIGDEWERKKSEERQHKLRHDFANAEPIQFFLEFGFIHDDSVTTEQRDELCKIISQSQELPFEIPSLATQGLRLMRVYQNVKQVSVFWETDYQQAMKILFAAADDDVRGTFIREPSAVESIYFSKIVAIRESWRYCLGKGYITTGVQGGHVIAPAGWDLLSVKPELMVQPKFERKEQELLDVMRREKYNHRLTLDQIQELMGWNRNTAVKVVNGLRNKGYRDLMPQERTKST